MYRFRDTVLSYKTLGFFAVAGALALACCAIWNGNLNQDEGWYMYAAQSVREGRLPYRDFFFTQGPVLPFVYSRLAPVWMARDSCLHGILGGRIVTFAFGLAATLAAAALARRLLPREKRSGAALAVFCLLSCNLYNVYFTSIVKTYALSSFLVICGFLAFSAGLGVPRGRGATAFTLRAALLAASGMAFALASGTRISLVLIPAVAGTALFLTARRRGASFVWFGIGLAAGLWPVYGMFAMDEASRRGLLAAQAFHAARGGFDLYNVAGSVSRLVRSYLPLCGVLAGAAFFAAGRDREPARQTAESDSLETERLFALRTMAMSFAAVFLLQISAPFPYDDYQTPIMGIAAIAAAVALFRAMPESGTFRRAAAAAILVASGLCAFSSPLLQEWFTEGQDRFWILRRRHTPIAQLEIAAEEIEALDPGGEYLLTQDLYLAVQAGRKVPERFEMGPFCYFPSISGEDADALHVHNRESLRRYLSRSDTPRVAAFSGYGLAIGAPKMEQLPEIEQIELFRILKRSYDRMLVEESFGQNNTPLFVYRRKNAVPQKQPMPCPSSIP